MREFLASGMAILGLTLSIIGAAFSVVGAGLAVLITPVPLGLVFLITGTAFLAVGLLLASLRMRTLNRRAELLRQGSETSGVIVDAVQNWRVRVNRQHPWIVRYKFDVHGAMHEGHETIMDLPSGYVQGARVIIAYDATDARKSAIKRVE